MVATTIIGVDFSGAKAENKTWVTKCHLTAAGALVLDDARPIRRNALCELLTGIEIPAVVGMDFPFGLPRRFAEVEFGCAGALMPEWWEVVAQRPNLAEYIAAIRLRLRNGDLREFNNCQRQWDAAHFPGVAISPLHPAGPEMFPMTFYGMKMLHTLWTETNCQVPPLDCVDRNGPVLLEVMPGAALRSQRLPHREYKDNKGRNPLRNLENRQAILANVESRFGVALPNLQDYRDLFIFNDDALDSFIASIVAALWAMDEELFHRPEHHQDPAVLAAAQREGCIYVPTIP